MNFNKRFLRILRILIMTLLVTFSFVACGYQNSEDSFCDETFLASIVQVTVESHTGSGIVWEKNQDEMTIVSNKHILANGTTVSITFPSGNKYTGVVKNLAEDYDIGFCTLKMEELEAKDKVTPVVIYEDKELEKGERLFHAGVNTKREAEDKFSIYYEGKYLEYKFVPEFYEMMFVSEGFSKPGMSGGGIFTDKGVLIGILTGGEKTENDIDVTYSLPIKNVLESSQ